MQSNETIYVDRNICDSCVLEIVNAIIFYLYNLYPTEMIKIKIINDQAQKGLNVLEI